MKRMLLLTGLFFCQTFPECGEQSSLELRIDALEWANNLRDNIDLGNTWYHIGFKNGVATAVMIFATGAISYLFLRDIILPSIVDYYVRPLLKEKKVETATPLFGTQQNDDKP